MPRKQSRTTRFFSTTHRLTPNQIYATTPQLVLVALDEQSLVGGRLRACLVLSEVCLGVGLRACLQLRLRGVDVLVLALPRLEGRLLERAAVREGERPGEGNEADTIRRKRSGSNDTKAEGRRN